MIKARLFSGAGFDDVHGGIAVNVGERKSHVSVSSVSSGSSASSRAEVKRKEKNNG